MTINNNKRRRLETTSPDTRNAFSLAVHLPLLCFTAGTLLRVGWLPVQVVKVVQAQQQQQQQQYRHRHQQQQHRRRQQQEEQATSCTLNGVVFQAGEPIGELFTTRCGSALEFPCFCNPQASFPPLVDCPYCGIPTPDNEEGIVCAKINGPTVIVTDLESGYLKECTCRRDDSTSGTPQSLCMPLTDDSTGDATPAPQSSPTDSTSSGTSTSSVCTLEWEDGTVDIFQNGESYGELFGCGAVPSEYPCFCNVTVSTKMYCPYCEVTMPTTGETVCARMGEIFQLPPHEDSTTNDDDVTCQCLLMAEGSLEAECAPTASFIGSGTSTTTNSSSVTSTASPAPSSTTPPTMAPTVSTITQQPSVEPTSTTIFIPSPTTRSPSAVPVPGCSYQNKTNNNNNSVVGFVEAGGILGDDIVKGPCTPSENFPVYCNPDLPSAVEYPYCVFTSDGQWNSTATTTSTSSSSTRQQPNATGGGGVVCAKNGDQVSVPTTNGTVAICTCLYLNPYLGAVSSCPDLVVTVPPSLALTEFWAPNDDNNNDNTAATAPTGTPNETPSTPTGTSTPRQPTISSTSSTPSGSTSDTDGEDGSASASMPSSVILLLVGVGVLVSIYVPI